MSTWDWSSYCMCVWLTRMNQIPDDRSLLQRLKFMGPEETTRPPHMGLSRQVLRCRPAQINEALSLELAGVCTSDSAIRNLKSLLWSNTPFIIFLLEAHSNGIQSTNTIRNFNTTNYFVVPSSGLSGGLWLLWDNMHYLYIISSSPNYFVVEVQIAMGLLAWNLIYVYGEPTSHKRREF